MHTLAALITTLVATQVDPNQGTAAAYAGSKARLQDPTLYDAVFPVIAFVLVIVVPSCVALWVIFKTVTEKSVEADET